ncbi:acyl-CoA carboxylase epsilon subunit [Streptomyces sp. NPDC052309]|uniref:Acyl-CoA carboxylase subunit epsilon n=1 Tax=Streptomyces griseicoloratus TaxID=2752516 RepID=A0A926QP28_9ACTN|nr:acyl-CoA carboxylase epsilon subunit [Streptomyces griseicoloratus]MBD0418090.1 acyl-CoA carboxylase subunit epsilon [Streptomyces griseicoloratus]
MSAQLFEGPLGPTLYKVVRGTPSAEELAVVAALLGALAAGAGEAPADRVPATRRAGWTRPELVPPMSWMTDGGRPGS